MTNCMAGYLKNNNSLKGCIDYANQLIQLCELSFPRISSIRDINSNFFVALFECITGHAVPDLLLSNDSTTDVHNIQAVIDTLSLDLLGLSLSHISGEDVASGNVISIFNLLEVLEAVFLHLLPKKQEKIKDTPDASWSDENSKPASSVDKLIRESAFTESEENIPSVKILKRKTCKNTLGKSHLNHRVPERKMSEASTVPSHSKWYSDTVDNIKIPQKRKISKHVSRTVKRPHTEGIEELYKSNFEKKVRALLQCDESPVLPAQQMKKNYIQSLKTPLKRTSIPPCKKSFLLPYNLRRKTKSPVHHRVTKKRTSCRKKSVKASVSENIKNNEKDEDTPAAIQFVLEEFPGFQFPKNTLDLLTKHYYHHVSLMHKQLKNTLLKKPSTLTQTEKAMEDEAKLSKILAKDLQEKNHLRELHEHRNLENRIKSSLRDARLQSAKMRQYFDEFQKSMSRKLQKRNFAEELLVEKTFKEILDLQKEKVRLLCKRVRETNEQDGKQHRQYLEALKNLYQQQLALLTESVNAEQRDSSIREKTEILATKKLNQEIRKTLQREVCSLQKDVLEMIEDIHFRELDAQNFIRIFQQQGS